MAVRRCMTGSGAQLKATGVSAQSAAVAKAILDIIGALDIEQMAEWNASVNVLDAPNLAQPRGSLMHKCIGDLIDHDAFDIIVYHDPEQDLSRIIGAEGVYQRIHQSPYNFDISDGTSDPGSIPLPFYWQGNAAIVSADLMPNEEAGELAMSTLSLQFLHTVSKGQISPTQETEEAATP